MMVEVNQIQKKYHNFTLNCSLKVESGCVTGLIGANGAGKSTTFKALLDMIKIDGGSVKLLGKEVGKLKPADKQQIGVVLAESGFSGYLDVNSIIPVLESMYPLFHKDEFIGSCQRFQIPMDKKIKEFSTGMKAKLKVLVATSHEAKILLLDEPTAGLDVIAREAVLDMLREYMETEGRAILISSHISSDLEGFCDDLYMLHDGKIIFHEDTDVLLDSYGILKVNEKQFQKMDREYIMAYRREHFGYEVLTKERQYYLDNHPDLVMEKGSIDEAMSILVKGERV